MIPRTLDELMQSVAAKMQAWIGNNPLSNPVANRSNPLVKLVAAVMQGQVELERRLETFGYSARIDMLSGAALRAAAARRCIVPKVCTTTKYLITVFGDDCAVMPAGSILYDGQGREWNVVDDITLSANGTLCASGVGVAESSECGCWIIQDGELFINPDDYVGISSATNSFLLEKGGEEESDEALRNRILNTGPLANIKGTVDHSVAALMALDGVNFVRTYQGELCGNSGFMFIVHGGNCIDICETLRLKGGSSTALLGDTVCRTDCFDNIKYQKPYPVALNIRLTLNCDCPVITQVQAEMMVRALASRVAKQTRISSGIFAKLHPDIEGVLLTTDCITLPYIDPISDQEVTELDCSIKTSKMNQGTLTSCGIQGSSTIRLHPWEYAVINNVTFADCTSLAEPDCG